MMDAIKWLHVGCAVLSGSGFFVRGILMMRDSALLEARVVKVAPHIVDTLLLVSAIVLASQWGWAALQMPWLLAKIIALLVYIGLGVVALRAGHAKAVRVVAWCAAMLLFAYIVSTALSKNAFPYIS